MAIFVVRTTYRHEHDTERLEARPAHREWLLQLKGEGAVLNAGPFADEHGAMLLLEAPSADDVRELLATDPYPSHSLDYEVVGEWKPLYPFG